MLIRILGFSVAIALFGCSGARPTLSSVEAQHVQTVGFDLPLMLRVREFGVSLERLQGTSASYESYPARALVLLTKPEAGTSTLRKVRATLKETPYSAYVYDQAFGYGPDKIAIMPSLDEYAYLAIVRTSGPNYDLTHEDVLKQIREWDERFGLYLNGAGEDWLEASFTRPPTDWLALAKEVYAFCPDVVDQGTGNVETLASEMKRENTLYLWWD